MVDSVVGFLLEKLTQLLIRESNLLGGVEDQVRLLKDELSLINGFLKNTKGKRHDNELVKEVVSQIRVVAYEAEDVIDTFIATVTKHRRRSVLKKVIHSVDRAIALREVANKIGSIKNVIKGIYENRTKYGIEIGESSGGGDAEAEDILHRRRRHVEDADQVVGFVDDTEALVEQLTKGSSQRIVVSIFGLGGLGKTTLAKKIYNNNNVKNYFNFRRWVYVSQKYRIRDLLLEILKGVTTPMPRVMFRTELKEELVYGLDDIYSSNEDKLDGRQFENFMEDIKEMNDEEFKKGWSKFWESKLEHQKLKNSLSRFVKEFYSNNGVKLKDMTDDELKIVLLGSLRSKRYLIVMDDIWNTEAWNDVSAAFPKNSNGSRILITTRIRIVASRASSGDNDIPSIPPHELQFLDDDKSWELFSKKVFWGYTCPTNLEPLGRQIVKGCKGLPLAIVVLGGLLANKEKAQHTWSKWIGHKWYLTEDRSCSEILALSYNDLPSRLKPCFLYFGIYPEGFEISVRQLIRLWIAEGFIQQIGDINMEDAAENFLEELIDRSLIEVVTKRLDGGVKTCRIHDLVRDLCILESTEEKFLEVRSDNHSPISKFYRISIHCPNYPYLYFKPYESSNCRSLIGFGGVVGSNSALGESYLKYSYLEYLCKNSKLARVVDLSKMGICYSIPKKIKKLILLRYLSIQSGELHVIPNSICKLWNLETLDMRNSNSEEGNFKIKCLPKGIWKLQKLRHLYLDGRTSLPRTDNEAGLPNLEVLTGIALNPDSESLIAKARFPKVRQLGLCATTNRMSRLLLSLCPLQYLQNLKVYKFFLKPTPSSFQLTITKITLVGANLSVDVIGVLGSLTKLRVLKVVGDVLGAINNLPLHCDANSFRQLEVFKMADMLVTLWSMGEGAMPSLQRLVIKSCEFQTMPPENLLTALRDVKVLHPSPTLATMLRQLQMKDGCKLQFFPPLPN